MGLGGARFLLGTPVCCFFIKDVGIHNSLPASFVLFSPGCPRFATGLMQGGSYLKLNTRRQTTLAHALIMKRSCCSKMMRSVNN